MGKSITNEMLSRKYVTYSKMFYYEGRQKQIAKSIRECRINLYEYYLKHGNLQELDSKGNHPKGISLKVLILFEDFIKERLGKKSYGDAREEASKDEGIELKKGKSYNKIWRR